jgi:ubiquinone/menaquinone biosynthesis C-methylase UbiE
LKTFRVLRPGGRFVIADVITSEQPAEAELQNAIEIAILLTCGCSRVLS